jgi:hypothetical protein
MFPFGEIGPFDRSEKKALLVAFLFCAVFVGLLSVSVPARRVHRKTLTTVTDFPFQPPPPPYDPLQKFRVVPENFSEVDFKNFSYGSYVATDGTSHALNLWRGTMGDESEWFELKHVFYKDLTGDGIADAIVRIRHAKCDGSSCDITDLFHIYTTRNGKLKDLWQYETGTYAYGCGLKSLTIAYKQMVMELFGRCSTQAMISPGPAKFLVEDSTSTVFEFDGHRFVTKSARYNLEPMRNVKNWEPAIQIY